MGQFSVQGADEDQQFGFTEDLGSNRKLAASGTFRVRIEGWEASRSIKEYVEELGYAFPVVEQPAPPVTDFYYFNGNDSFNIMEHIPSSSADINDMSLANGYYSYIDSSLFAFSQVDGLTNFTPHWTISRVFMNALSGCQAVLLGSSNSSIGIFNVMDENKVNIGFDQSKCQEFAEKIYRTTIAPVAFGPFQTIYSPQ